ncbi:MAG: type II toxin-antitoxin system VapC family toxin [Elusimicrobia bacterium]|nr:type II toxin-antitoxin system VapC family toxin [Elusimicrobiota bacterium]
MIFVDTSAFLALWLPEDGCHPAAAAAWDEIQAHPARLFTSSLVLSETVTLLGRRAGAKFAAARARSILYSDVLSVWRPEAEDERAALAMYEKYADQGVSFTDAVSFALMRRHRVLRAFTFDAHFARAGFGVWTGSE